jgi:hypothetical protein
MISITCGCVATQYAMLCASLAQAKDPIARGRVLGSEPHRILARPVDALAAPRLLTRAHGLL